LAKPKWEPSRHTSGKWRVTIPAKLSDTGRRRDQYFDTKKGAEEFIADTLEERQEHGKQAVSSEERHWIQVVTGYAEVTAKDLYACRSQETAGGVDVRGRGDLHVHLSFRLGVLQDQRACEKAKG
jgi:hypothetical protein